MFKTKKKIIMSEKFDDVLALLSDYGYDKIGETLMIERQNLTDKKLKLQAEEIEMRVAKFCGYIINEIITDDLLMFIKDFFSKQFDEGYKAILDSVHSLSEVIDENEIDTFSLFLYGRCQAMISVNLANVLTAMFIQSTDRRKHNFWSALSHKKRREIEKNAGL